MQKISFGQTMFEHATDCHCPTQPRATRTTDSSVKWGDVHAVDAIRLKHVNVMGCMLSTGQLITSCLQEPVNNRWFYAYLTGVAEQVKQAYDVPLVLIVDNASIHRSKQMAAWRKLLEEEYSTSLYFLLA